MHLCWEMRSIRKTFSGTAALSSVDFTLNGGEIHALLGENGAGKTTLMNIMFGLMQPDEGEIRRNNTPLTLKSPAEAIERGVGMVHQHFMLVPVMTVLENLILGTEETRFGGVLHRKAMKQKVRMLSRRYGLFVDPDAVIGDLPVGARQRVEILKVLYRNAEVFILDEPTAVLTPDEVEALFQTLITLKEDGKAVVFISHKLREVMQIADRITVLRDGKIVATPAPAETTEAALAAMMVGPTPHAETPADGKTPGEVVVRAEDLAIPAGRAGRR